MLSLRGFEPLITLVLAEAGADVDGQGGLYGNALQAASVEGHSKIVQQLLEHGADVNAQGGLFGNALYAAAVSCRRAWLAVDADAGPSNSTANHTT
ncbi:hypothetical protein NEMBOFW57_007160 [Staphylotrichum longicolle]|uniref:Ankyrin repeat protein n=1 Tax=Staphylotrichum longicolle TaxID=669026 RepID=A0AAD4EXU2_9PEZI|nr:hypothetical protein NEMBOFW57_007160 [Staphylotrichum longicolle]